MTSLTEILAPWLDNLGPLPGGNLKQWEHPAILRGISHWYAFISNGHETLEHWVATVRSDHVEVREPEAIDGRSVVPFHTIAAADPDLLPKLEQGIRQAIDFLVRDALAAT